ncbi:macrosialin isoform X2 [Pseudophryne corroboree]|uniref:macrosialin isoform X2 n=1 Tax=Pseudophryne corroboree TaxID=495146 RepID=UPI003081E280
MGYLRGAVIFWLYMSGESLGSFLSAELWKEKGAACTGEYVTPGPASTQSTTTPQCIECPKKTTTHSTTQHTTHTTTPHTTQHTNHTTTPHTTQHTNHTTTPHTTQHTNHTTTPHTTQHTNHTTAPHTTQHTNHTTTLHTTQHTNHTTTPHTTQHTNHTTTPHTTQHTNHTTTPHTTQHTNHTTAPHTTHHTNHTTTPHTTQHTNHTTQHHTTNPHTTQHPTPAPSSSEYVVNGTSGVCLRMRAAFKIKINGTKKMDEIVIPAPPSTQASGNCSGQQAQLTLTYPRGQLILTFRQNETDKNFYLGAVNITVDIGSEQFSNTHLRYMVTPLGRSFSCEEVDLEVTPKVQFVAMDVRAQAFKLQGGNYGKELKCSDGPPNMTVPIVIGVILLVLVLVVVLAYVIARQRSHGGYQTL